VIKDFFVGSFNVRRRIGAVCHPENEVRIDSPRGQEQRPKGAAGGGGRGPERGKYQFGS